MIGTKHTVYFARDKIKGAGVVGSINNVTSLSNRFTYVHHFCFGNKWINILFSRTFLYYGHLKQHRSVNPIRPRERQFPYGHPLIYTWNDDHILAYVEGARDVIVIPCHVVGSKHTVYFVQDKIKGADVVGSRNHVTSLTNKFPKLISLPTSTIFVSGTSKSVFYFLEFSCTTAILKI